MDRKGEGKREGGIPLLKGDRGGKYRGKGERKNQSVGAKFFLLNLFYG